MKTDGFLAKTGPSRRAPSTKAASDGRGTQRRCAEPKSKVQSWGRERVRRDAKVFPDGQYPRNAGATPNRGSCAIKIRMRMKIKTGGFGP